MPSTYPTEQDLMSFLYGAQLIDSESAPTGRYAALDYRGAVNAAIREFERRTGQRFQGESVTAYYDPPTLRSGYLALGGEWSRIDEVVSGTTVLYPETDFRLQPVNGPPYQAITFLTVTTEPLLFSSQATVQVTGTRGTGNVPDDVWQAVLQRAASLLIPSIVGIQTSGMAAAGVESLKLGDADVKFKAPTAGSTSTSGMGGGWDGTFERIVLAYRRYALV